MPYFIAAVKKPDLEQGKGGEGGGGESIWHGDNRDARMPSGKYDEVC